MVNSLRRAWQLLTKISPGKTPADLAPQYAHFPALLSANHQVLSQMAEIGSGAR